MFVSATTIRKHFCFYYFSSEQRNLIVNHKIQKNRKRTSTEANDRFVFAPDFVAMLSQLT